MFICYLASGGCGTIHLLRLSPQDLAGVNPWTQPGFLRPGPVPKTARPTSKQWLSYWPPTTIFVLFNCITLLELVQVRKVVYCFNHSGCLTNRIKALKKWLQQSTCKKTLPQITRMAISHIFYTKYFIYLLYHSFIRTYCQSIVIAKNLCNSVHWTLIMFVTRFITGKTDNITVMCTMLICVWSSALICVVIIHATIITVYCCAGVLLSVI